MDIEHFLEKINLVDLVERAGAKFSHRGSESPRSACPLHHGENPTSFSVYRNGTNYFLWYCHSNCGGGDAIDFVMRWKGLDFVEAVQELSSLYHINLDDFWKKAEDKEAAAKKRKVSDLLTEAAKFFQSRLESEEGKPALDYLINRGFTLETIQAARLGFTRSDQGLYAHLQNCQAVDLARSIGVINRSNLDFTANRNGAEASPDGYIVYPHWVGSRCVFFSSRAITPKERMPDPNDKCRNLPGERRLFRADVKGKNDQVTIVEGPLDALTLYQLGQSAWALCGLGSVPDADLHSLKNRQAVYISTDGDEAGKKALRSGKVAKLATLVGPLTMILPSRSESKDFNDWLQTGNLSPEFLANYYKQAKTWIETRMEQARDCDPWDADDLMSEVGHLLMALPDGSRPRFFKKAYEILGLTRQDIQELIRKTVQDGKGQILSSIKDGQLSFLGKPLLNGYIHITNELIMDDGQNKPTVRYSVSGRLVSGQSLEPLDIEAEEFDSFKWIPRHWGRGPILYIPRSHYYELTRAIQEVSMDAKRERVYTFTGWTTINGERAFLSSTGAVLHNGLDENTRVDLGINNLRYFALPKPPEREDFYIALQASLEFLELGPRTITAPLWAAMFAAPLTEIAPLYAVLWVYGQTQSGKSTIVHLALCHFGSGFVDGRQYHAPMDWTSTQTALEGAMFTVKDCPIVLDDFAPQFASAGDSRELHRKAAYIIRSVGNRSSRGRARADLSERAIRIPRGLVIATAENPIMGQSIIGRTIFINVGRQDILPSPGCQKPALEQAQDNAQSGLYAQTMAGYLKWLAANWDRAQKQIPERINLYAKQARESSTNLQNRLPDYYALLAAAQELALEAFCEMDYLSPYECRQISEDNRKAILAVVEQQAERIAVESPVRKIFEALGSLLARKKVYLAPRKRKKIEYTPPYGADLIGWFDTIDTRLVFLETNTCIAKAKEYWSALSENLDIQPDAFLLQVSQIPGLIRRGDRIEESNWIAGKTRRALTVIRPEVIRLYGVDLSNESSMDEEEPEAINE